MEKLNKQQKMNKPKKGKHILDIRVILIIVMSTVYIFGTIHSILKTSYNVTGELTYTQLMEMIDEGKTDKICIIKGEPAALVIDTEGNKYDIVNPQSDTFIEDLMKRGASIEYRKSTVADALTQLTITLPVAGLLIGLTVYMFTVVMGSHTKTFSVIKNNETTFDDIRGITETKEEVKSLISTVKDWKNLGELGARPIKGLLFYGPPGTGKTMLAKAIAHETNMKFISASGSDFIEQFVGMGARRIRDLWILAETNAPCVLFIDEIDCLGKRTTDGDIASREHNQTMNALLQRMDGLNTKSGILVVAATNSIESLDDALLRSGRFDRKFYVGPPSTKADRDSVVELYTNNKKLADGVTVEKISKLLYGFTAADIDEIMSDAVYISLTEGRNGIIQLSDVDDASMKLRLNGVKKEHTSERDMEISAVHESGHTLVRLLQGDKVAKVSIVAYSSGVGGVTIKDIDEIGDRKLLLQSEIDKEIRALLAGKCAEDVIYGEHTQGCSNDMKKASELIHKMITSYAYDDSLLFDSSVNNTARIFEDKEVTRRCNEVLKEREIETKKMIIDNIESLNTIKDRLLKEKTLVNPTI